MLDRRVWLLTFGQSLLSVGRGVLMPFATLYFYEVRHFPLTLVGLALAIALPLGALVGLAWGAVSDRAGRRPLMLVGFAGHAVTTAALAFVSTPPAYVVVVVANAVAVSAWSPSARAMVADVTPPDRRARGYGLLYLANNFGLSIGLVLGGALALFLPYRAFFFAEAAGAAAFLVVVAVLVPESHAASAGPGKVGDHVRGLSLPLRDPLFLLFALANVLGGVGWSQFYSTFSPFVRDVVGVPVVWLGVAFAVNTVMVVALQMPIAERVERASRTRCYLVANYLMAWWLLMTWAASRLAGSLAMALALVLGGVAIMTLGEIMVAPVGASVAAGLAGSPRNYGKYLAALDLAWTVSSGLGAVMGGAFFDAGKPTLLWPVASLFTLLAFVAFLWLGKLLPPDVERPAASETPPASILGPDAGLAVE